MANKEIAVTLSDEAILAELGDRIARQRLDQQQTQTALAEQAGISKRTLERIEAGASVQVLSLLRVLRALGLIENLNLTVPDPGPSPLDVLKLRGKERQRATSARKRAPDDAWQWGDDT